VFSTSPRNWKFYNWSKITTLVEVQYHDDEMVKYAHSKNVTVSYIGIILFSSLLYGLHVYTPWSKNNSMLPAVTWSKVVQF